MSFPYGSSTSHSFVLSRFSSLSFWLSPSSWPATYFRCLFRDTFPLTTPSSTVPRVACGAACTLSAHPSSRIRSLHLHLLCSPTWMAVHSRRPGKAQPGFRQTWVPFPLPRPPLRVPVSCSRGGPTSRRGSPKYILGATFPAPYPSTVWVTRSSSPDTPYPSPFWIHLGPPRRGLGSGVPYGRCSKKQVARISVPA